MNIVSAETITAIWEALNAPLRKATPHSAAGILRRVARDGWGSRSDLEDFLFFSDARLDRAIDIQPFSEAIGHPWRTLFFKPRARSISVMGSTELAAADVAAFLMDLEQLGFAVDPMPLVEALTPEVKKKKRLTDAELSVLWYPQMRHKREAIDLRVNERAAGAREIKELALANGYKASLWLDKDGAPLLLSVSAPKHRARKRPVETLCPECGYTWFRGDPDSSAAHRKTHKERMVYLAPQPQPQMIAARAAEGDEAELVTTSSPVWKHREIYGRAAAFRREFSYDFVQWHSSDGDDDPTVHGYLFTDEAGVIVGACAFRYREGETRSWWALQWIWVAPPYRRSGIVSRYWPGFRERFGDFHVEGPVSDAMVAFLKKRGQWSEGSQD